jgi:MHS family proline/betaine transporter-like MFS transporter
VTSSNFVPAYLMMGACVMGGIALLFVVETAGHSLRGTKIPGTRESQQEIRTLDSNDETGAMTSLSSSYR